MNRKTGITLTILLSIALLVCCQAMQNDSRLLSSPEDLQNKRIAVLLGSTHDAYAQENYPDATIMHYRSLPDMVVAVRTGRVDAALFTRENLPELFREDERLGTIGDSLFEIPVAVGFNKNNTALRDRFNEFLRQIKAEGVYTDMVNRWIERGDTHMPEIPNTKARGVLVAGNVSDKGMPFTAVKDNRLIGFDIELAERFAAWLEKDIRFSDMEFGSLIMAAVTNKVDMIVSTLMITEERQKQIDFSDPYYNLGISLLVLKENIADERTPSRAQARMTSLFQSFTDGFHSNIIKEKRYFIILDGLRTTFVISIMAALFGTVLGGVICYMRMSKKPMLTLTAKIYISIVRGIPVLVLLMLIFYVVFASVNIDASLVAVIAFGMNFGAYAAEIFRTGVKGVPKGQTEAGIAMGFTRFKTFQLIVLPQMVRGILPVYKGELVSLVKMTSIVGYIAVQDLTKAGDIIRSRTFDAFFPLILVAVLYYYICWMLLESLEYIERRIDPKARRRKLSPPPA